MSVRWTQEDFDSYLRRGQPPLVSEVAWQKAVMLLLKDAGYTLVYHTHDSRRSPSGWPDVAAIKPTGGTLFLVELKTDVGQVTPAQAAWLEALGGCTGVVSDIWRPAMLEEIVTRLRA